VLVAATTAVAATVPDDSSSCRLPLVSVTFPEKTYMPQPHVEAWMKPGYWKVALLPPAPSTHILCSSPRTARAHVSAFA
jgi:hypothetical protein